MSLWSRWFGGEPKKQVSDQQRAAAQPPAPSPRPAPAPAAAAAAALQAAPSGRKVSYDPQLIDQLKHDHGELLQIFGQVGAAHQAREYALVAKHLHAFKLALQGHILSENVRFYAYLQGNLLKDSDEASLMHEFRREMNTIARGVTDFLKEYGGEGRLSTDNHAEFAQNLGEVGALLVQRIEREERNLYPLYHA